LTKALRPLGDKKEPKSLKKSGGESSYRKRHNRKNTGGGGVKPDFGVGGEKGEIEGTMGFTETGKKFGRGSRY